MATAAVSLTLSGNPITVNVTNPNTYYATLVVNSGSATNPSGTVTITDSNSYSVAVSSWALVGSGVPVAGQISFLASGTINAAEGTGTTVTATYSGADYTVAASNTLTVGSRGALYTSRNNYIYSYTPQTFNPTPTASGYAGQDNTNFVFQKDQYRTQTQQTGN